MGVNSANDLLGRRAGRRAELELWGIQGSELRVVVIFTKACMGRRRREEILHPNWLLAAPSETFGKLLRARFPDFGS